MFKRIKPYLTGSILLDCAALAFTGSWMVIYAVTDQAWYWQVALILTEAFWIFALYVDLNKRQKQLEARAKREARLVALKEELKARLNAVNNQAPDDK